MEKEFVPYELALKLKQLGFDEPCFGWFRNTEFTISFNDLYPKERGEEIEIIKAPTFSQAFRWFREKYGLSGWVDESFGGSLRRGVISIKSETGSEYYPSTTKLFYTYEEAELDCLTNLIEIVEQKENI